MNKINLAYLAGIIDGEGSIRIEKRVWKDRPYPHYRLRLSVSNTNIDLMNWLLLNVGGKNLKEKKRIGSRKQQYQWEEKAPHKVLKLIELLLPFLIIKQKQAQLALRLAPYMRGIGQRLREEEREREEIIYREMKSVNQRGFTEPVI